AISEVYQSGGIVPAGNDWGCAERVANPTKFVTSIATSANGIITVTLSGNADLGPAANKKLTLSPMHANGTTAITVAADMPGQVGAWKCAAGTIDVKYLPGSCR